jgi:hypothetical protein
MKTLADSDSDSAADAAAAAADADDAPFWLAKELQRDQRPAPEAQMMHRRRLGLLPILRAILVPLRLRPGCRVTWTRMGFGRSINPVKTLSLVLCSLRFVFRLVWL